ncbi:hypothetical protein V2J09_010326 [Rumex salicifolius]
MAVWKKFDPWNVFFKREWNRNWPFLVGFAVTGTLITKFSLSLTGCEELSICSEAQEALKNKDVMMGLRNEVQGLEELRNPDYSNLDVVKFIL